MLEENQIQKLADFYGAETKVVDIGSTGGVARATSVMRSPATAAILLAEDVLGELDRTRTLAALRQRKSNPIPIMVFGITEQTDQNELKRWSGGVVRACNWLGEGFRPEVLEVAQLGTLTRQLRGMEFPAVASPICKMQVRPATSVQTILAVREGRGASAPVLVRARSKSAEVFFVPQQTLFDLGWTAKPTGLVGAFSSIAPFVLFLSYAAGDHGWHLDGHYANLTIDDAWLTQPYGRLDYPALLAEMQKHNFHTTIAFIPWNYDRSEPDVVTLFRSHPEKFSVCIHGDDHDHREFGSYAANSLRDQTARIKQSIARMERFHTLTKIPYDRFMVFPQGVAPEETFVALKKYGFLGTANSLNVPLGVNFPVESTFILRPYTVKYADFLSLARYPAANDIPRLQIAIHSFLGNQLLFYGHEDLFQNGFDVFDGVADVVHQIQPDTHWASLGEIARHSHLIRRREDGEFDVRMLSAEMDLRNPTEHDAIFYVRKQEDAGGMNSSLTIDGSPVEFERVQNTLILRLVIHARQVRKLRLAYQSDLDLAREDIGRRSAYVYALRRISDFRDLRLSKSLWGRAIVRTYYHRDWNSIELRLEQKWWVVITCVVLALAGFWYHRGRGRIRIPKPTVH